MELFGQMTAQQQIVLSCKKILADLGPKACITTHGILKLSRLHQQGLCVLDIKIFCEISCSNIDAQMDHLILLNRPITHN